MAHKYGNTATPYKAPKRNAHDPGQFASGESPGGTSNRGEAKTRTDPSSGELRGTRKRTGMDRKHGVVPPSR